MIDSFINGVKYILRGIVFIIYFPFHLIYKFINFVWMYVLVVPCSWIWKSLLQPVFRILFAYPLQWIWKNIFQPVLVFLWSSFLVPIALFLWTYIIFPIIYFVIYYPIYFLWKYIFRWFYYEILIPVLKFCESAIQWLLKGLKWFWLHLIYYPIRWLWIHFIFHPLKWIFRELIKPVFHWFRSLFHS